MITITLTDGSFKRFDQPVTAAELLKAIGRAALAKAALAAQVDERLVDLSHLIEHDASVRIITAQDADGLSIIRHSTAHLLAQAVKLLFPEVQVVIGPVIADGFYYDFASDHPLTLEDLKRIEAKMKSLVKKNYPIAHRAVARSEAIDIFQSMGESYKVKIIQEIPEQEALTLYSQGDFVDLCRGPHVPRTGLLTAFKLTQLSGAYWRGDSNNAMLQRIYGTAWANQADLKAYLHRIEQAEKRDHRKLAKKMDLLHFQADAPGMVFWHPNGWVVVCIIREYLRAVLKKAGYLEVNTPQVMDQSLWQQSGHLAKFAEEMFCLQFDQHECVLKPMNCPGHIQIFKQGLKSYRDLPLRLSEFGCCHRNEPSGALHGLMRVRALVQDDGHIFCTEEQIQSEVLAFIQQLQDVYRDFGFTEVHYKLSTRPEKRVGTTDIWDKAEQALSVALEASGVKWSVAPGEGAFYGPKIEFALKDCLGREWQCGTMQVDFSMPDLLQAQYVAEDNSKHRPVMLHRAIIGSLERFIGILLEQYEGHLPIWLAPIQAVVIGITDRQTDYVQHITHILQDAGLRVSSDLRNEKIGFKIRQHSVARVPYQLLVGDREQEQQTVSVRHRAEPSVAMSLDDFISRIESEVAQKRLD